MYVCVLSHTLLNRWRRMKDGVTVGSTSWRRDQLYGRTLPVAAALLTASDPMDLGAWECLLADDVHVRIANRPVAVGRAQCVAELDELFRPIAALGRTF